jgi:hypothetical protein
MRLLVLVALLASDAARACEPGPVEAMLDAYGATAPDHVRALASAAGAACGDADLPRVFVEPSQLRLYVTAHPGVFETVCPDGYDAYARRDGQSEAEQLAAVLDACQLDAVALDRSTVDGWRHRLRSRLMLAGHLHRLPEPTRSRALAVLNHPLPENRREIASVTVEVEDDGRLAEATVTPVDIGDGWRLPYRWSLTARCAYAEEGWVDSHAVYPSDMSGGFRDFGLYLRTFDTQDPEAATTAPERCQFHVDVRLDGDVPPHLVGLRNRAEDSVVACWDGTSTVLQPCDAAIGVPARTIPETTQARLVHAAAVGESRMPGPYTRTTTTVWELTLGDAVDDGLGVEVIGGCLPKLRPGILDLRTGANRSTVRGAPGLVRRVKVDFQETYRQGKHAESTSCTLALTSDTHAMAEQSWCWRGGAITEGACAGRGRKR